MALERVAYRLRQGVRAMLARPDSAERTAALVWLPAPAREAFLSMPATYQRHHLDVYGRLWRGGCRDGEVLAAALLHDIGKLAGGRRVWLWQRAVVVLSRPWPRLLGWLATPTTGGWRHGFYLHRHHPALGATRARMLGCSPRVVTLIAAHQSGDLDDPGLRLLRAADDAA